MESLTDKKKPRANVKDSFFARLSDATVSTPASNANQIKTGGCEIVVKGKTIEFERKDPIFSLRRPIEEKYPNGQCHLCDKGHKKSSKKQKYCDFCGNSYCKECFKSRPFPKSDNNGPPLRGEICMICDRKFIAKDIQLYYEEQIDKKEVQIKQGERTINAKKEKLDNVIHKVEELQKEDQTQQAQFENDMEDLNLRMEVIQNQIRELNNENDKLQNRIQIRNEEGKRKQDEKVDLTGDIDGLKHDILTLESKVAKLKTKYDET
jgi:hypothetical protein